MLYQTILEPTTSAAVSSSFYLQNDQATATVLCMGLAGAETCKLQVYDPIAEVFVDAYKSGSVPTLNPTSNIMDFVDTRAVYRMSKSATVASVGISLYIFQNKV